LDGFVVLAGGEVAGEVELLIETAADLVGCPAVRGGRAGEGPAPDLGAGPAGRWASGGAVLVEAGLVLPAPAVRATHLDRAAPGDRGPGRC
jgi:hypothetical protein